MGNKLFPQQNEDEELIIRNDLNTKLGAMNLGSTANNSELVDQIIANPTEFIQQNKGKFNNEQIVQIQQFFPEYASELILTELEKIAQDLKSKICMRNEISGKINIMLIGKSGCGQTSLISYMTQDINIVGNDGMGTTEIEPGCYDIKCGSMARVLHAIETPGFCSGVQNLQELTAKWNKLIKSCNSKGGINQFLLLIKANQRMTSEFFKEFEAFRKNIVSDENEFWNKLVIVFTAIDRVGDTREEQIQNIREDVDNPAIPQLKEIVDKCNNKIIYVNCMQNGEENVNYMLDQLNSFIEKSNKTKMLDNKYKRKAEIFQNKSETNLETNKQYEIQERYSKIIQTDDNKNYSSTGDDEKVNLNNYKREKQINKDQNDKSMLKNAETDYTNLRSPIPCQNISEDYISEKLFLEFREEMEQKFRNLENNTNEKMNTIQKEIKEGLVRQEDRISANLNEELNKIVASNSQIPEFQNSNNLNIAQNNTQSMSNKQMFSTTLDINCIKRKSPAIHCTNNTHTINNRRLENSSSMQETCNTVSYPEHVKPALYNINIGTLIDPSINGPQTTRSISGHNTNKPYDSSNAMQHSNIKHNNKRRERNDRNRSQSLSVSERCKSFENNDISKKRTRNNNDTDCIELEQKKEYQNLIHTNNNNMLVINSSPNSFPKLKLINPAFSSESNGRNSLKILVKSTNTMNCYGSDRSEMTTSL